MLRGRCGSFVQSIGYWQWQWLTLRFLSIYTEYSHEKYTLLSLSTCTKLLMRPGHVSGVQAVPLGTGRQLLCIRACCQGLARQQADEGQRPGYSGRQTHRCVVVFFRFVLWLRTRDCRRRRGLSDRHEDRTALATRTAVCPPTNSIPIIAEGTVFLYTGTKSPSIVTLHFPPPPRPCPFVSSEHASEQSSLLRSSSSVD